MRKELLPYPRLAIKLLEIQVLAPSIDLYTGHQCQIKRYIS
jgi:hypothetical protein